MTPVSTHLLARRSRLIRQLGAITEVILRANERRRFGRDAWSDADCYILNHARELYDRFRARLEELDRAKADVEAIIERRRNPERFDFVRQ